MRQVWELKNPDIIEINGKKFQVLEIQDGFYDIKNKEMDYCIELTIPYGKRLRAGYQIRYTAKFGILARILETIFKKQTPWKFFALDRKTKRFKEQKVKSFKF
ncbi:MAG: hypothetical protein KGH55_00570 [Nanoarchaeota archaeon]|nr:hypothetical protein [Nanoarchaeota archaeon]